MGTLSPQPTDILSRTRLMCQRFCRVLQGLLTVIAFHLMKSRNWCIIWPRMFQFREECRTNETIRIFNQMFLIFQDPSRNIFFISSDVSISHRNNLGIPPNVSNYSDPPQKHPFIINTCFYFSRRFLETFAGQAWMFLQRSCAPMQRTPPFIRRCHCNLFVCFFMWASLVGKSQAAGPSGRSGGRISDLSIRLVHMNCRFRNTKAKSAKQSSYYLLLLIQYSLLISYGPPTVLNNMRMLQDNEYFSKRQHNKFRYSIKYQNRVWKFSILFVS